MRKRWILGVIIFLAGSLFSCAQETCPGAGNYYYAPAAKIVHRSSRIKPKDSMIHTRKSAGRKPPK